MKNSTSLLPALLASNALSGLPIPTRSARPAFPEEQAGFSSLAEIMSNRADDMADYLDELAAEMAPPTRTLRIQIVEQVTTTRVYDFGHGLALKSVHTHTDTLTYEVEIPAHAGGIALLIL